jgi:hypothetical protein
MLLASAFAEDEGEPALARIVRALDFWKKRLTIGSIIFAGFSHWWGRSSL